MQNTTTCQNDQLYRIALTLIENVGAITAKKLLKICGTPEAVFKESIKNLKAIEGIGEVMAKKIANSNVFLRAEQELKFIEENGIQMFYFEEDNYPSRLRHCVDSPIVLYGKGNLSFNEEKVVSIVGTRKASKEGKRFTEDLIEKLKAHNVTVVSGLAYGIDITAHKKAYEQDMQTIAVLAHGLQMIYPALHKKMAKQFQDNGGILTDFPSGTIPDRERFPSRNRIVAGLSDATIVIESKRKGGSIITADIAGSYNRDVFAVPGAPGNELSEGCNYLIKSNRAALLDNVTDLEYLLGWDLKTKQKPIQQKLFVDLSEEEEKIVNILKDEGATSIDDLAFKSGLMMSSLSMNLLKLELDGVVMSLPGKKYKIN